MSAALPLSIQRLLPIPLRDRVLARSSGLWMQELTWDRDSERVLLLAPSGTGKTTLIHMLYGLRHDYEGTVSWGGVPVRTMDPDRLSGLRRESISIVFQDMRLFPELSAWENLEIKRVLSDAVTRDEARSWMEALGIADRADRPAATLSYGEQQRVSIIRALLQPFCWLLMDEPFSHLDEANTAIAADLIAAVVARNGASFLLAELDENDHFDYTQKSVL